MRGSSTRDPGGGAGRLSGPLRVLFGAGTLSGLTDGQLLDRYRRGRGGAGGAAEAEAAFAALVERHGPMVLSACRAILGDRHDAEDACQAAFLVLARRAGAIRRGDAVSSWLYGVARRVAARARRDLARRRDLERRRLARTVPTEPASGPPADPWPELYEELDRLAEPFRAAVVLCDLEGRSYEQAAGLLGCPVGTIQSRLSRGRQRLRQRLERRGIAPAVVGIGAGGNPTALSPSLSAAIVRAAGGIAGSAPAAVAILAGAEIRRQVMIRLTMSTMLLAAGVMATAAIGLSAIGRGDDPAPARPPAAAEAPGPIHVRVVDLDGKGVPGILVEWRGRGRRGRASATDADGRLTMPRDDIHEGSVLIAQRGREAVAWYLLSESRRHRPAGTEADPIAMILLPVDHRVEGSVVDGEGRPVAGVEMRADLLDYPVNSAIVSEAILEGLLTPATSGRDGRFAVSMPRGASARLRASHSRWVGRVGVPPDARILPPAVLKPSGSVVGRVIDGATGRPVAGAVIAAQLVEDDRRIGGSGWVEAISDDRGRFRLGAEPGVHNVLFFGIPDRPGAAARAVECVRVRAGADTTADLTVIDARPLRGIVVDRDTGEPLPGAQIGCYGPARPRSGAAVESRKADDRGRFTFHVPPGEQSVYCMGGYGNSRLDHRDVIVPEQGEIPPIRLMMKARGPRTPIMAPAVAKVAAPQPVPPAGAGAAAPKGAVPPRDRPAAAKVAERAKAPVEAAKVRTVTGRVRDPQGRPLAGVRVDIPLDVGGLPPAFPRYILAVTDRDGLFLFPDLPRLPLKIRLGRAGYRYEMQDLPADRDAADWTFHLVSDPRDGGQSAPTSDEPVLPELRDRLTFVDLQPQGTDYLADGPAQGGNDLNRLPRGVHKLGQTYFRIGEKMVHVQGRERPDLPRAVKGIPVHARGPVLHFLHSAQGGADMEDKLVGAYVIHYTDGSIEQAPIVYSRDITNWWHRDPGRKITQARPAWTGVNDLVEQQTRPGLQVRLFDMTWINPHPEREIATLDVLSAGKDCDPFLVAVTVQK